MKIYTIDIRNFNYKLPDDVFYNQINKYNEKLHQTQHIVAWSFLYKLLKEEYNITDFTIYYNEYNKPYLKDIYFNISHSLNMVAIIISNEECGIDIECLNEMKNKDALKKHFNVNSDEEFLTKWTKKEAYLKKVGTGIKISSLYEDVKDIKTTIVEDNDKNIYYLSYC